MTAPPTRSSSARSTVIDATWFFAIAVLLCFALAVPMVFRLVPTDFYNLITPILQLTPLLAAIIMWLARRPGTSGTCAPAALAVSNANPAIGKTQSMSSTLNEI